MNPLISRRRFIQTSASTAGLALTPTWARAAGRPAFSFVLLGDLHYDKLEHHDLAWLQKTHPNDLSQIQNYTRITRDIMPALFATVRETIADLNRSPATRVRFVLQVGDLVEGLCGTEELAVRHNTEALAFVRDANLGAPFLFTKGNHDVTGEGAVSAFRSVFHPFLTAQARAVSAATGEVRTGCYVVACDHAEFAFFDAYESGSLEWFEAVAARRSAEHFFVVVHPPVVPYGARATWHIFSREKETARRQKFLELLGTQRASVLGGHIHRFNSLARETGRGRFAQLALSSVVHALDLKPKMQLSGPQEYTPDQIRVEPEFSPTTEAVRRAVYESERLFVKAFEYADLPGYAVVTVDGPKVTAQMFSGTSRRLWRTVDLGGLLA